MSRPRSLLFPFLQPSAGSWTDDTSSSSYFPLISIDLCEPLLEVARKRFAAKGWKHVHCLKQDATEFVLPDWEHADPRGSVTLATLSYSLSMVGLRSSRTALTSWVGRALIRSDLRPSPSRLPCRVACPSLQIPAFYPLLDRVHSVLDPEHGLVGVADFYTAKDGGIARERVRSAAHSAQRRDPR